MIDFQEMFHVGIRVHDLQETMDEIGTDGTTRWCTPQHRRSTVWIPGTGVREVDLDITFSADGPVHLELLHGTDGTPWGADQGVGVHHIGIWVDDVGETTDELVNAGWVVELSGRSPEEGYGHFSYVRAPSGTLIEAVSKASRPNMERFWAGGSLG